MKTQILQALAILIVAGSTPISGQPALNETRDVLDKWVETRQIISEEKADWRTESSILTDTKLLLASEAERLSSELEDLESSATAADEDRKSLTEEKEKLAAASGLVVENLGALETKLKMTIARLPEPLADKIKPLSRRLPDDPTTTELSLGERVQNVVGILSQVDKFNSTVNLTNETQEMDGGKLVQVNTMYWGIATAYFVDAEGTYGGYGVPTDDGWEWVEVDGVGPALHELLSVYKGTSDTIKFVKVPAVIK